MAFLVKNECKNLLLIEKLVHPEACDISPQIILVQAGFIWPIVGCLKFLKAFKKIFHIFCIFWSNFKIFPLAFEASKPKKMSKNAKSMNYTLFYLLIFFFRFLMSFFTRFSDLYLTRFGNLDFQSSLAVSTDPSLDL